MNAHGQSHLQGSFPGGMPSQQQNTGVPRGGSNPSQGGSKQPNSQGAGGQYRLFNEHLLDPQLSLWTIAKPQPTTSWEDVEPEQLHVAKQEVERRMAKFNRKGEEPAEVLINMKSQSARKAVKELIDEQNEQLWEYNPTIQYFIASIQVDKEIIKSWPDKGRKRIKRIDIILKTEPRPHHEIPKAFLDAMQPPKPSSGGKDPYSSQGGMGPGGPHGQKPGQPHGQGGFPGQQNNMPPQGPRAPPGAGPGNGLQQNQSYGPPQGQNFNQPGGQGFPPPPPPPPNGQPGPHGHGPAMQQPPPPPPPGPPRQPQVVQPQGNMQPNPPHGVPPPPPPPPQMPHQPPMPQPGRTMPGAFPSTNAQPRVEILDPRVLEGQKARPKGNRRDSTDTSDSEASSLFSDRSVDGFRYVERSRSRGRRPSYQRDRSRSRSRGRDGIFKSHRDNRAHGPTRPDFESPPRDRQHNNTSPNPPNPAMPQPQNIFNIKIDNDAERAKAKAKGRDAHKRTRDPRRASHSISPTGFPPTSYRGQDKYAAEAMYRSSSNNGSDSESSYAGSSSIYTASDRSIFDEPKQYGKPLPTRPPHLQPRDGGFVPPTFDYDHPAAAKHHYQGPNDYPSPRAANRSPSYDDHIMPPGSPWPRPAQVRRGSQKNPFDRRYSVGYGGYGHETSTLRYLTEREQDRELEDLADALERVQRRRGQIQVVRRGSARVPPGGLGIAADTDEWANRAEQFERGYDYPRYRHVN